MIGPRCAGKSAVGARLAQRLDRPFADLDEWIVSETGCGIAEWLRKSEAEFREIEYRCLQKLAEFGDRRAIIATGGGTVAHPAAAPILKTTANIYLCASAETLRRRMQRDTTERPALLGIDPLAEIESILKIRERLYQLYADVTILTDDRDLDSVVDELASRSELLVSLEERKRTRMVI
jgi:shikimate kinase